MISGTWAAMWEVTDGKPVVKVKADTVGKMLDELISIYPNLEPIIEAGVSVAVDGEMVAGADHTPIKPDSEIFLLQQFKGG